SCDLAKSNLAKAGVTYTNVAAPAGTVAEVRIGSVVVPSFRGETLPAADFTTQKKAWDADLGAALKTAGYPAKADSALVNKPVVIGILFILVFYVTMVYGPIAAALVEMFPTNIRYTSMSLPYHIGNGWFGGFLPTTAFAMVAATGNIYYGLWYPIVIALATAVLGFLLVKEGKDVNLND
ncbi:MAG: MFS transporter, partial [Caulobacteraceae bacterium]